MLRREFVRLLLLTVFAPGLLEAQKKNEGTLPAAAPTPWTLGLNPRTPLPETTAADGIATSVTEFFTAQQMATLTRLSEVLLPALDGRPGALEAETPQFLDFLIGSSSPVRKMMYTAGLDWLNAEALKRYRSPFARLDPVDAGSILDPLLRAWIGDHPPAGGQEEFINVVHADIREATVNSAAWQKVPVRNGEQGTMLGLYWSPIEPVVPEGKLKGCEAVTPSRLSAPE